MNATKLAGRTALFRKDREMEAVIAWLSEQAEVLKIIPRGWRPGGSKGKIGFKIDGLAEGRITGSVYHGSGRQEVLVTTNGPDAAVALMARACQKYSFPPPDGAKVDLPKNNGKALTTVPSARLVSGDRAGAFVPPAMDKDEQKHPEEIAKPTTAGKIESSLRIITPDDATKWLEGNTLNRSVSQKVIDRYASDMRAGRWGVSETVIAFDVKGNLINGQHRLWAVVDSGVSIKAHVATGYPTDAIKYFDDGYRRDYAQVYNLTHGDDDMTKAHMAIARRIAGGGWKGAKGEHEVSRQDTFAALEAWTEGIAFAVKHLRNKAPKGFRGLKSSGVLAVVARAYYSVPLERLRLEEFCEVLCSGLVKSIEDNAAVVLRNWMASAPVNSHAGQTEAYAKTENALRAFLERKVLTSRIYAATEELFPMPGEKVTPLMGEASRRMAARGKKTSKTLIALHKERSKVAGGAAS